MEHPYIKNVETLYQVSGMVDQLRDTALTLSKSGKVHKTTLKQMAEQYDTMRADLRNIFKADAVAGLDRLAPVLDRKALSAGSIYFAAAALARWADLIHSAPKFLVEYEVMGANIEAAKINLKDHDEKKNLKPVDTAAGTYL